MAAKQWKKAARHTLKANYGRIVAVCVLVGILVGGLSLSPVHSGPAPGQDGQAQAGYAAGKSNMQILEEFWRIPLPGRRCSGHRPAPMGAGVC